MTAFEKIHKFAGIVKARVQAILDDDNKNSVEISIEELIEGMEGIDELLIAYRDLERVSL